MLGWSGPASIRRPPVFQTYSHSRTTRANAPAPLERLSRTPREISQAVASAEKQPTNHGGCNRYADAYPGDLCLVLPPRCPRLGLGSLLPPSDESTKGPSDAQDLFPLGATDSAGHSTV